MKVGGTRGRTTRRILAMLPLAGAVGGASGAMQISDGSVAGTTGEIRSEHLQVRSVHTPWIDLSRRTELQTILDRVSEWSPDEPAPIRSPDGEKLLWLMGSDERDCNSVAKISTDGGQTWSAPIELPVSLTGDGYLGAYLPDGRLLITFRDLHESSPTRGDFVAWVGTLDDLLNQREASPELPSAMIPPRAS